MTRRQAREEAFILIFEKQFNDSPLEEILDLAIEVRDIKPDDYVRKTFFGVYDNLDKLDGIISANAIGWNINRISKTALAVLRLSIFEILYCDDIDAAVSINEAVELLKKYATQKDAKYVNGILSSVEKAR
ncbi:MAG: transcription antitermination factor NusB [Clostridia bacterium]|nr:transcription antitermination factor NusB [Clostridia bacterium]